jgi:DNA-binding NarL/FixJ family response regulator
MGMVKEPQPAMLSLFPRPNIEAFLPVKILLADDSEVIRKSIRRLLDGEPDLQIVGEACDFAETVRLTRELQPQVLVLDLHMSSTLLPSSSILRDYLQPTARLLAISASNDADSLSLARSLGADSFLDKMDLFEKLVPAILQLSSHHFPPANAQQAAS